MSALLRDTLITLRNTLIKNHKIELELLDKQIMDLGGVAEPINTPVKTKCEYEDNAVYALENVDMRTIARKRMRNSNAQIMIHAIDNEGIIFNEYNTKTQKLTQFKITANVVYGFVEFLSNTVTLNTSSFLATLLAQSQGMRKSITIHRLYQTGFVIVNVTGMEIGTVGRPVTYYFTASEVAKLPYTTRGAFNL